MKNLSCISLFLFLGFVSPFSQGDKSIHDAIDKAVDAFNAGEYEKCIRYTDILIQLDPTDYISWTLKGRALYNLDEYEESLEALNTAIRINPKYSDAYAYRAVLNAHVMDFDTQQVIRDFDTAIKGEPANLELIKLKGGFLSRIEYYDEALEAYNALLASDPDDYQALVYRGRVYRKISELELAAEDLNHAVSMEPMEAFGYEERAFLFIETGQLQSALADFNTLIELAEHEGPEFADSHAYTWNNRGYVYYKLGDAEQALRDIEKSLEMLPTNPYAYRNRALVHLMQGKTEVACRDMEQAIELGFREKYGDEVDQLMEVNCM